MGIDDLVNKAKTALPDEKIDELAGKIKDVAPDTVDSKVDAIAEQAKKLND